MVELYGIERRQHCTRFSGIERAIIKHEFSDYRMEALEMERRLNDRMKYKGASCIKMAYERLALALHH